jgi:pyruvate-formate lyase-activating enzyme
MPIGFDEEAGNFAPVKEGPEGGPVYAAAAFMAPAYTGFLMPAFITGPGAPVLPLFAYTAIGELDGQYWVPATRVDPDQRQDPERFDGGRLRQEVPRKIQAFSANRLVAHLGNCALVNHCPAAMNFFLGRFEAPLPSAPACNSACLGCLSLQPPESGFPCTQKRILFVPTAQELAEVAASHLESVQKGVASFGQGCEGEPLMNPDLLKSAVSLTRKRTRLGTLNLNTNASRPEALEGLAAAGLDAIRVSLNSAQEAWYDAYFRPKGYQFGQVKESLKTAVKAGLKTSINYFVFPGVSDRERELEALLQLIQETGLHMIQWRNLNLDPELYLKALGGLEPAGKALGIPFVLEEVKRSFPDIRYGYFNPPWKSEA